jgi:hypothetical protein
MQGCLKDESLVIMQVVENFPALLALVRNCAISFQV